MNNNKKKNNNNVFRYLVWALPQTKSSWKKPGWLVGCASFPTTLPTKLSGEKGYSYCPSWGYTPKELNFGNNSLKQKPLSTLSPKKVFLQLLKYLLLHNMSSIQPLKAAGPDELKTMVLPLFPCGVIFHPCAVLCGFLWPLFPPILRITIFCKRSMKWWRLEVM